MQNNDLYILGIPTSESLVTDELLSFVNDQTPTILLFNSASAKEVNGYSFIKSKNIVTVPIDGVETALQDTHIVCCSLGKNIYLSDDGMHQSVEQIKDNFFDRINVVKQLYPNIRLAYCVFKSPYTYIGEWLNKAINSNTKYSISVIDCKSFEDDNTHNFSKFIKIVTPKAATYLLEIPEPFEVRDKSGIFFKNDNPTLIKETYTNKTFEQIVDETALTYAGKKPLVAWSGGIDSTTILAAFIKNNIDFKVTFNDRVLIENKDVYDYIKDKYEIVNIPNTLNLSELQTDNLIVTGEGCDQLYPKTHSDYIPGFPSLTTILLTQNIKDYEDILLAPVDPAYLYNNVKQVFINRYINKFKVSEDTAINFYESYVVPVLNKMPINIEHFYQLDFMIKLIFNYDHNIKDSSLDKYYKDVVSFYDTENFQRWAITNLDANFREYGLTYLTHKSPNKDYNYSVFKIPSLLNQIKMHSTYRNFNTKELVLPKSITYYQ
jgi:hypothetical protein